MIDQSKAYKTRSGKAVRVYATDAGPSAPIHGAVFDADEWMSFAWQADGTIGSHSLHSFDLIESDPHGILPRHRELLAEAYDILSGREGMNFDGNFGEMIFHWRVALIALARLESSLRSEVGE